MKVVRCEIYQYNLPLKKPFYIKSHYVHYRQGGLVRLVADDNREGWGDIAPFRGISKESVSRAMRQAIKRAPDIVGTEIPERGAAGFRDLLLPLNDLGLMASVQFGFETALCSLMAQAWNTPLHEMLSGATHNVVSINALLAGSVERIMKSAEEVSQRGYRAVKLKVGRVKVTEDIRRTVKVRELLGDEVVLRLDANRAWSFEEALEFATGISGCGVEYLEEPLTDPGRLPELVERTGVPVALDETLTDLTSEQLHVLNGMSALVIKPTIVGGLLRTLELAEQGRSVDAVPVISAVFESGVGILALAQIAASLGPVDVPVGLDTYRWLGKDLLDPPLALEDGTLDVTGADRKPLHVNFNMLQMLNPS